MIDLIVCSKKELDALSKEQLLNKYKQLRMWTILSLSMIVFIMFQVFIFRAF